MNQLNAAQHILIAAVRLYRLTLSPLKSVLFGPLGGCRYTPSCSEYALEALRTRGAFKGSWLSLKRIGRCHPWGGCGYDPVPKDPAQAADQHGSAGPHPGTRHFFGHC